MFIYLNAMIEGRRQTMKTSDWGEKGQEQKTMEAQDDDTGFPRLYSLFPCPPLRVDAVVVWDAGRLLLLP